jgi:protein TonB
MSFVQPRNNPLKPVKLIAIAIAVHVIIIWALISGLAQKATAYVMEPMNASLIEEITHIPKPEIPKPKITPKIYVAKSELKPPISSTPMQATSEPPPPSAPASPPAAPVLTGAKIDMSGGCQTPRYPESARLAGESGAVTVGFLIGVDGRIKDNKILASSGFRDLDIAAKDALELCRFRPGTENGQFVESWAKVRYVWRLN